MRLSDAMKPAMEWSEAAMLPARPRTLSDGAALRQLKQVDDLNTVAPLTKNTPAPAEETQDMRSLPLRRAAFRQVTRLY